MKTQFYFYFLIAIEMLMNTEIIETKKKTYGENELMEAKGK